MRSTQNPRVSIVATARNDDHGGNLLRRMQLFCDGVRLQANRHSVPVELILVDWNPPQGKPDLTNALRWAKESDWCEVRIVTVPPEIHGRLMHASVLPLYQMIAKNVGIRRARGDFVLATNVDILFEDEMFQFLGSGDLKPGVMYRCDRYDVAEMVPTEVSMDDQLRFCRDNIIQIYGLRSTVHRIENRAVKHFPEFAELFEQPNGHANQRRPVLHTNACGDFQLMSREDWFRLRGYPEYDLYSFHLDSVLAFQAFYTGIPEVRLGEPFRIYHIDHPLGGWKPEQGKDSRFEGVVAERKLRRMTDEELEALRLDFESRKGSTIVINPEKWGFIEEPLRDRVVTHCRAAFAPQQV